MTKKDLQQIGGLFDQFEKRFDRKLDDKLATNKADLIVELDQRMDKKLAKSEERMIGKIVESEERMTGRITKVEGKIVESEERMIGCIGQVLEDNIFPQFEQLRGQIAQLPTKGYLDEKIYMALEKSSLKLLQEDEKVDRFIDVMHNKKSLTKKEVAHINKVKVFPKI